MMLFPARKRYSDKVATLLPMGRWKSTLLPMGVLQRRPVQSLASGPAAGGSFLTDQASRTSLRKIRRDYVNAMAVDEEDDEPDDDDDEE